MKSVEEKYYVLLALQPGAIVQVLATICKYADNHEEAHLQDFVDALDNGATIHTYIATYLVCTVDTDAIMMYNHSIRR